MKTLEILALALMVAATASCWHHLLSTKNHIAAPVRNWLDRIDHAIRDRFGLGRLWAAYQWITRSATSCSYCLAGQLAIIVFITTVDVEGGLVAYFVDLGIFVATTIYLEPWTGKILKDRVGRPRPDQA